MSVEFEFDDANIGHFTAHPERGLTLSIIIQVAANEPLLFADLNPEHSGSHRMIGPDDTGRFWTIVVLDKGDDVFRPITGWPSTNSQIRIYNEASNE